VQLPLTTLREEVPPSRPSNGAVGPRRVLVIDDNRDFRDSLRMWLELAGHQVDEAADGVRGLDRVLALRPDIAFVDLGLPGHDGYKLARATRCAAGGESLYLVALTGYGQPDDRRRAIDAGFDAYLVKPVDQDELSRILAAAPTQP
jgi:CheY-like chemotaxis protein